MIAGEAESVNSPSLGSLLLLEREAERLRPHRSVLEGRALDRIG